MSVVVFAKMFANNKNFKWMHQPFCCMACNDIIQICNKIMDVWRVWRIYLQKNIVHGIKFHPDQLFYLCRRSLQPEMAKRVQGRSSRYVNITMAKAPWFPWQQYRSIMNTYMKYCSWKKSGDHLLRLVAIIPLFTRFYISHLVIAGFL